MSTILIIEDNNDTAQIVKKILETRHHTVIHAPNGLKGLSLARTAHADLILIDFDLPDLDGRVILNQLNCDPHFARVIMVAFTADDSPRNRRLAHSFGCRDFIGKPINIHRFADQIDNLLATVPAY